MDAFQNKMEPSWFRLSDEAIDIARKMVSVDYGADYFALRVEFMKNIPDGKKCFFGSDSPAPWGLPLWRDAKDAGFMVAFNPGDDLVAVISKDEVLYKEDFAEIMQDTGLEATEGNFNAVWLIFSEILPDAVSLRDCAEITVREIKNVLKERTIDEILSNATDRAVTVIGKGKEEVGIEM